jgi:glycosyltransferase involved in cell wall biosynthesis
MLVAADAFVLATHGEGWCRPLMEGASGMGLGALWGNGHVGGARDRVLNGLPLCPCLLAMAMEVPVIATNWSGPTQFIKVSGDVEAWVTE